jgi:hypothetical protein
MNRRPDSPHEGDDRYATGDDPYTDSVERYTGSGADDIAWSDDRAAADSFPWPPPEGESIITAFVETWKGASLTPSRFFGAMPATGSVRTALLYYLPLGIVVSGANLLWALTIWGTDADRETVLGEMPLGGAMNPLLEFLLSPVILLLSLFIAAAVTHGLLKLLGGANRSLGFTTRIFAYAYSPQVLAIVPVVGTVMGFVWMVVVAIVGLRVGHRASLGRVLAAVLIPVATALIFMAVAAFIATTGRVLTH